MWQNNDHVVYYSEIRIHIKTIKQINYEIGCASFSFAHSVTFGRSRVGFLLPKFYLVHLLYLCNYALFSMTCYFFVYVKLYSVPCQWEGCSMIVDFHRYFHFQSFKTTYFALEQWKRVYSNEQHHVKFWERLRWLFSNCVNHLWFRALNYMQADFGFQPSTFIHYCMC